MIFLITLFQFMCLGCLASVTSSTYKEGLKSFIKYEGYKLVSNLTTVSIIADDADELSLKCILKCVHQTGCSSLSIHLTSKQCLLGSSRDGSHLGSAFEIDINWLTFLDKRYTGKFGPMIHVM